MIRPAPARSSPGRFGTTDEARWSAQRSYGKGSVQGIFPLNRYKSGIRLTTSKFYSPSGQPISDRGVTPHVEVHPDRARVAARVTDTGEMLSATTDPVLQAGLDVARRVTTDQVGRVN